MGYTERKRWLFFGLPFTFTKYVVGEDVLTIQTGFFTTKENDCYMYKIQDVEWEQTLLERIFGLGTVVCFTGDVTHPQLRLEHIKNSKTLKNYILENSEAARIKRRTLNTMDISADIHHDLDGDGACDLDHVHMDSDMLD